MSGMEVLDAGVRVRADAERIAAWTRAAGDESLAEWLATVADEAAEAAIAERTFPSIVPLKHPVEFGGQRIASLEFRRGRIGDIKGMQLSDKVPTDQLMLIASRLCGQPLKVIEMLDVEDAGEAMAIALSFFGKCLGGGKTRSRS